MARLLIFYLCLSVCGGYLIRDWEDTGSRWTRSQIHMEIFYLSWLLSQLRWTYGNRFGLENIRDTLTVIKLNSCERSIKTECQPSAGGGRHLHYTTTITTLCRRHGCRGRPKRGQRHHYTITITTLESQFLLCVIRKSQFYNTATDQKADDEIQIKHTHSLTIWNIIVYVYTAKPGKHCEHFRVKLSLRWWFHVQ